MYALSPLCWCIFKSTYHLRCFILSIASLVPLWTGFIPFNVFVMDSLWILCILFYLFKTMSSIKCNKTQSMPLGTQPAGKQSGVGCQPLETVNNMSWVFFLFNFKDFQCILYLLIKVMVLAHIPSHKDLFY